MYTTIVPHVCREKYVFVGQGINSFTLQKKKFDLLNREDTQKVFLVVELLRSRYPQPTTRPKAQVVNSPPFSLSSLTDNTLLFRFVYRAADISAWYTNVNGIVVKVVNS